MGKDTKKAAAPEPREASKRRNLLNRMAAWYRQAFGDDPRASQALTSIGLADPDLLENFRVGWANSTVLNTVPEGGELQAALKGVGLLDASGRETLV